MNLYNKYKNALVFFAVVSVFVFLFSASIAQANGIVPCQGLACKFCHLFELFKNIIDFIIYKLVFPVAAIMIVVGGFFIMTASGSSSRFSKGKEIITAAVVGLLIALTSWIIINTIIGIAVNYKDIVGRPWNDLQCK